MLAVAFGLVPEDGRAASYLNGWASAVLQAAAAVLILVRAVTATRYRAGLALLGFGATAYAAGMFVWVSLYGNVEEPPFPSWADPLWLTFYPCAIVALGAVVISRVRDGRLGSALDGVIAACTVASLFAAVILGAVLNTLDGEPLAVTINLAYPVGDLVLLSLVAAHVSLAGWSFTPRWAFMGAGLALFVAADAAYTYSVATEELIIGALINAGYCAGLLLLALGTWMSSELRPSTPTRVERMRTVIPSLMLSGIAVAVLVTASRVRLSETAVWLATTTLLVALARTALAFRENIALIDTRRQALEDDLTGLPNRRMLLRSLTDVIADAELQGTGAAILLIDLDRFKEVNDSLGHHVGDELLRIVGRRLLDTLRGGEIVARLGGDEFCVILPATREYTDAQSVATRILGGLDHPVVLEGMRIDIGASIGIAAYPDHGITPAELLRSADVAMYRAKEIGGGEQAIYRASDDTNGVAQLALAGEFRGATERGEIVVHYQPRYDSGSGRIRSIEALVRWDHPTQGLLSPSAFLPGVERSALIVPLTEHVLRTALADASEWLRAEPELSIAVNLSARLLHSNGLVTTVREALADAGVLPERLELEITETMLMANPERATDLLEELAALGVRIAVDDFGVGHASLSYLTNLPVSILKIDRSFIERMNVSDRDAAVVATIVDLTTRLGIVCVAEGIEKEDTLEQLASLGCDEVQGFLMATPMPADEIGALLTRGPWGHRRDGEALTSGASI
jgi:diguanylate cyclase (GGDEF)-like protein